MFGILAEAFKQANVTQEDAADSFPVAVAIIYALADLRYTRVKNTEGIVLVSGFISMALECI